MSENPNSIPRPRRERLFQGAKFDFERLTISGSDGQTLTREIVRHPGAVVILPILEEQGGKGPRDPQIVLIKNWRIAIEDWIQELPAGTLEKDELPERCAARELEEETGFSAATITPLCRFYSSPGLTDELMYAYAATGLRPVGQRLEPDERVTVHPTPLERVIAMIESGELADGKSVLCILLALRRGLFGKSMG